MVSLVDETKTKLTEVNSLGWWLPIAFDEDTMQAIRSLRSMEKM